MKWKVTNNLSDINLEGIKVDGQAVGDTLREVTLTDRAGNKIQFRYSEYRFEVLIPAPPKTVSKFKVGGLVEGKWYEELFDSSYSADIKRLALNLSADCMAPVEVIEE